MYFARFSRTSSVCLSESLAPLALIDCQAPSNAATKVRTALGSNTPASPWSRRNLRRTDDGDDGPLIIRPLSLDHLVRERKQLVRHGQAERLRGIEIYDHHVFCGKLDRQVGRLLALKNAIDVARHDPILID
jgi:hypothetical protein